MSDNRVQGAAKKSSGAIKEAAGKVANDPKLEGKGKAEKTVGGVQNKVGKVQDALRR